MAAKNKDKDGKKKGKVKTKNLKLQKVTVGELSENELNKIQGGVARTGKPVSYTHLDVYKRQPLLRGLPATS